MFSSDMTLAVMVVRLKMYLEKSHAIHELKVNARNGSHVTPLHGRASCCVDVSGSQWDLSAPIDYIHYFFFLSFAIYLITAVIPAFNELTMPRWTYSSVTTSSSPFGWLLGSHDKASSAVTAHVATLCVMMICCQFSSCSLVSMLPF